jgi:hypothetical protein
MPASIPQSEIRTVTLSENLEQVALFLYFGRMGLPIPFRVNVTQVQLV